MVMFVDMSLGEKFVVLAACSLLLILHSIVYFFGNVEKMKRKKQKELHLKNSKDD